MIERSAGTAAVITVVNDLSNTQYPDQRKREHESFSEAAFRLSAASPDLLWTLIAHRLSHPASDATFVESSSFLHAIGLVVVHMTMELFAYINSNNIAYHIGSLKIAVTLIAILAATLLLSKWRQRQRQEEEEVSPLSSHRHNQNTALSNGTIGGGDTFSPCSDPTCLRCRPSVYDEALKRNAKRLKCLIGLDPTFAARRRRREGNEVQPGLRNDDNDDGVSDFLLALGTTEENNQDQSNVASRPGVDDQRHSLQQPTVLYFPGLDAVPFHRKDGLCFSQTESSASSSSALVDHLSTSKVQRKCCYCSELWSPGTGILWHLEHNFESIRTEFIIAVNKNNVETRNVKTITTPTREPGLEEDKKTTSPSLFIPFDPNVYNGRQGGEWSAIYLWRNGVKNTENCPHFPIACSILSSSSSSSFNQQQMMGCAFGSAYFSQLKPGTRIAEHCGPTNARLRAHLPLRVPKTRGVLLSSSSSTTTDDGKSIGGDHGHGSACELIVGGQTRFWSEGQVVLFDDSFRHSAVHRGTGDGGGSGASNDEATTKTTTKTASSSLPTKEEESRIVLIVDLWHPQIRNVDRKALGVLFPPGM